MWLTVTQCRIGILTLVVTLLIANSVSAAHVLLVSDGFTDTNIADALRADGHSVRVIVNDYVETSGDNPELRAALEEYDVIYWSATGSDHRRADVFTNLSAFVTDGGRVFVTGFDAIAAPEDLRMIRFLGGSSAVDAGSALGPTVLTPTSLTAGVVDIRGITPAGHASDRDMLTGLGSDTLDVAPGSAPGLPDGSSWTLRRLGWGEIAFVSNGEAHGDHASWTDTRADGHGAYNAAIRNFAQIGDVVETEAGAPEIGLDGPSIALEGDAIELFARVRDPMGGEVVIAWDLDDDGRFEERVGERSARIPRGQTDGPSTLMIRAHVEGSGGISVVSRIIPILNGDPVFHASPPRVFHENELSRYTFNARDPAGDRDTLRFEWVSGPRGVEVDEEGHFSWSPTHAQVTRNGEVAHFSIRVFDEDGASAEMRWTAEVSANRPPPPPTILHPSPGERLLEAPRLVLQNVQDPNHDVVSYYFELDSASSFDSPALQLSGRVAQGVGYTMWMPPAALTSRLYHWRAWTSDGEFASPTVSGHFWMGAPNTPLPDAAPPDLSPDGSVRVDAPPPSLGCACTTQANSTPLPIDTLCGALIGLWVWRRRAA